LEALLIRSFVLAAGLAVLAGPACAFPALTTVKAGFLAGPGADYDTLGTLPSGAHVDIIWCGTHKSWCLIQVHRTMGWMLQADLVDNTHKSVAGINYNNGGNGGSTPGGSAGGGGGSHPAEAMATEINPNRRLH
jgi:uncharacterized protein YraI